MVTNIKILISKFLMLTVNVAHPVKQSAHNT